MSTSVLIVYPLILLLISLLLIKKRNPFLFKRKYTEYLYLDGLVCLKTYTFVILFSVY